MKILLTLTGQSPNMNPSQLFETQGDLDAWLVTNAEILKSASISGSTLTFDGGSGTIEQKPDNFSNL